MGWGDKVGRHEGYVVCVFADGRIGGGMESGGIPVFGDDGQSQLDGKGNAVETRPAAAVVGWRVACSHAPANVSDDDLSDWYGEADFWTGPSLWRRVYSPTEEDLSSGLICVSFGGGGGDIVVEGRGDVHELMLQEWRTHVVPEEHTRSIRHALATIADAARTVDLEVTAARAAGLSWAEIGKAAGITRQSAHGRWGPTPRRHSAGGELVNEPGAPPAAP